MKRTQLPPLSLLGSRIGAVLLAASLLALPGLVPPAAAVEPTPATTTTATPAPTASTPAPPASPTPAPATPSPSSSATPSPSPSTAPVAVDRTSEAYRAAMTAATRSGGAEMGEAGRSAAAATGDKATTQALATEGTWTPTFGIKGMDVSQHQPSINWQQQWNLGARFVYIKATEGNYYTNPIFSTQYSGSRAVGMIRGAYHFANPAASSGADQARIFVQNGGGWSNDGYTMPPVLDFEGNPYAGQTINGYYQGNACYDMSRAALTAWAKDFSNTMKSLTGRLPVIYTGNYWWKDCVGNPLGFGDNPLWLASYPVSASNDAGPIPASWSTYSIWQFSSTGPFAGDSNVWNGSTAQLQSFARGTVGSNGAIDAKWVATGGATGPLGAAKTTSEICGLVGNGCYRAFTNGNIYWTSATGAHPVTGAYWTAWGKAGWQTGIGYATSDATCPTTTTTCHQTFQGGNAYNTPGVGTFVVKNSYMAAWKAAGWQDGIGYPKSNENCGLYGGGCYQEFTRGNIYWSAATGAHAVTGDFWAAWGRAGWQTKIGYPTNDVTCGLYGGGCYQSFSNGNIYQSSATGAHAVTGAFWNGWKEVRFQTTIGYPTNEAVCGQYGGGCYQTFAGGTIYWSSATGAHAVTGEYWKGWQRAGFQPKIGYPTGTVSCGLYNGGCYQPFTGGNIYWSAATGAHAVTGAYWKGWGEAAWQRGIGYPKGSVVCGLYGSGCYQPFSGGNIYWTAASGAHAVNEPYMSQWRVAGWQMGKLGYPTQAAISYAGYKTVRFQGGTMTWTASGVKVAYF